MSKGTLYLVPTGLGGEVRTLLPDLTHKILCGLGCFVAENPKSARAFLKSAGHLQPLQSLSIETLNEHTPESRIAELLVPLEQGTDCGLVSEAGAPAVADPGAALVRAAHAAGIRVVPLVGPSALLLALMACGLNGQRFAFHGYLPVDRAKREKALLALERAAEADDATQIFIEAPYRNDALFAGIVSACRGDTWLSLATDLTLPTQAIATRRIKQWTEVSVALDRRPTVFLLYRSKSL
jgi:16S rRNA (cytidine1402-2'-O)-methyltransferase